MRVVSSAYTFLGGVHPAYHKDLARDCAIETLPLPSVLTIPLQQHIGAPSKCVVKVGEHVAKGQVIGEIPPKALGVVIHAPVAGTVKAINKVAMPNGAYADAVTIEVDSDQNATPPQFLPALNWQTATPEELLARVRDCGICGMGGAGFPTCQKLTIKPPAKCEYLIINGAECEPYLSADDRVMRERASRIRIGIEITRKILGNCAVRLAVEVNKPEAIAALTEAFKDISGDVELVKLPVRYPQGSEKHQIYGTVGRRVPPGALPISVGCVVENVGTIAAIADAVELGKPLIERVTTVSGDGIITPRNILAPIGTAYSDLATFCGGEHPHVRKVISGGPMMGFTVSNLQIPTTKTTSGLLFFTEASCFQYSSNACINCGRCLRACPMNLNPAWISQAVEAGDIASAEACGVMNCIECGACSFGCPAYRHITQLCRRAKASIKARMDAERAKAKAAAAQQAAAQAAATPPKP